MLRDFWNSILDAFASALGWLEQLLSFTGAASWGWAIIALTVVVRIFLLPLAIKQIRSMRAMQAIQPQMREIQKKYKADRELMRKDPEQYRAKRQKMNEEMMALYQAEGVNPMASCLPLIAQAPIFIALFQVLAWGHVPELAESPFYFFTRYASDGLTTNVSAAGWPGWLLVILMGATLFISQKQMMARQAATGADNPMAQQQKILLYVMPVFLAVISFNLPLGVLLYWVTTNFWQAGQQAIMLREVKQEAADGTLAERPGGEAAGRKPGKLGKLGRSGKDDKSGKGGKGGKADGKDNGRPSGPSRRNPGATSSGTTAADPSRKDADPSRKDVDGSAGARGRSRSGKSGNPPRAPKPTNGSSPGSADRKRKNKDHLPRRR